MYRFPWVAFINIFDWIYNARTVSYILHLVVSLYLSIYYFVSTNSEIIRIITYKEGRGRRGRERMVVGFTTTCAISAHYHTRCEFESPSWRCVLDIIWDVRVCILQFLSLSYYTIKSNLMIPQKDIEVSRVYCTLTICYRGHVFNKVVLTHGQAVQLPWGTTSTGDPC